MLAVPSNMQHPLGEQYATFVAYIAGSNPWSVAMLGTLGCLPRLYRAQDAVFLLVDYEQMSASEQLHHRLSGLPALKMYCKVCKRCSVHDPVPWSWCGARKYKLMLGMSVQGRKYILEGRQSWRQLVAFAAAHVRQIPSQESYGHASLACRSAGVTEQCGAQGVLSVANGSTASALLESPDEDMRRCGQLFSEVRGRCCTRMLSH